MRLFVEFMPCLGDLVTELPILHAIRAVICPLDVEVSVDRGEAGLLDDYDWIARRHVRTDRLASRLTPIPSSYQRPFDVLLYLRSNPSIKLTRLFVRAKRKLGPERYDEAQSPMGVIPHRYSILRHVLEGAVPDIATRIVLKPERTAAAWAATGLSPGARFACVGPGAGEAWRRWPAERFGELARALRDRFDAVIALGARSEAALVDDVGKAGAVSMIGHPLPVVAALLAEAGLYVGNDSGLSHLAAAQGCPAVSIGLEPGGYYTPWQGTTVPGRVGDITVNDVMDRLQDAGVLAQPRTGTAGAGGAWADPDRRLHQVRIDPCPDLRPPAD